MTLALVLAAILATTPFGGLTPAPGEAPAAPADPAEAAEGAETEDLPPLDRLYDELSATETSAEATVIASQIESLWESSGSATADLLVERASMAMAAEDPDMAARHLDDALRFAPEYAEGWVRRAQLHAMQDEHAQAVAALEQALTADPRHYRALMVLANTLESMDSLQGAYEAYGEALEVHPFLEDAEEERDRLAPMVEGRTL